MKLFYPFSRIFTPLLQSWAFGDGGIIIIFILLIIQLPAQDNRLRLQQADLLENKNINGKSTQFLTGNVVF